MNKYYWILYQEKSTEGNFVRNTIEETHPFFWIKDMNDYYLENTKFILLNWKEITKEEYELTKQHENPTTLFLGLTRRHTP